MPPLPRLRIPALDELARQVRFEPAKAARRQIEFAESLAAEIDPERTYPEDWVVFRLTGYRGGRALGDEQAGNANDRKHRGRRADLGGTTIDRTTPRGAEASPTLIVGAALLADLPTLVERLSVAARLSARDLATAPGWDEGSRGPYWIDAAALCERWRISRKTLDRYRRLGLIGRRIVGDDRRHRLMFSHSWVEAFERRHVERLKGAAGFTRIDRSLEQRMIRRAERYRRALGCSLNQAAARLAERFGRSHEAVRQLLKRNDDAAGEEAIFDEAPPLRDRERRIIERAVGRGIETAALAERYRTTPACVYRSLIVRRAERLRGLDLSGVVDGGFEAGGVAEIYLKPPSVRSGLGAGAPGTLAELLALVAGAAGRAPDAKAERERASAYWFLRFDAARRIGAIPERSPSAEAVDGAETRLRWAARLKAELVRSMLPLAVKSIEAGLSRPVTALPTVAAAGVVRAAIDGVIEGVERFDPFRGGRLAAPVGLAVNRAVTQWMKDEGKRWAVGTSGPGPMAGNTGGRAASGAVASSGPRASPRADPAMVVLDDWTRWVAPWQVWLEPDARVRMVVERLAPAEREVLTARMGWMGEAPATVESLAAARGVTAAQIVRLERRSIRSALAIARGGGFGEPGAANGG